MTCVEEAENFLQISTILLCVQGMFVIIFFGLSKHKRIIDVSFFLGLLIFHPRIHKNTTDCGEEMFQGSLLFLCTTVGLLVGFHYRNTLIRKTKES